MDKQARINFFAVFVFAVAVAIITMHFVFAANNAWTQYTSGATNISTNTLWYNVTYADDIGITDPTVEGTSIAYNRSGDATLTNLTNITGAVSAGQFNLTENDSNAFGMINLSGLSDDNYVFYVWVGNATNSTRYEMTTGTSHNATFATMVDRTAPNVTFVSPTLGANYSNSYLSVKTLLERLETGRNIILQWLEKQCLLVARAMGFQRAAKPIMSHMSLTDEQLEKELLLELFDRNMLTQQTMLARFGEDFEVELQRHRRENRMIKAVQEEVPLAFLKTGKFGPSLQNVNVFDLVEKKEPNNDPMQQENEGDSGGRPKGTKKPQRGIKKVKPKGEASATASIDDIILDEELYRRGKARFAALYKLFARLHEDPISELDESKIYGAIVQVMCTLLKHKEYTKKNIALSLANKYDSATAPAKLDRCVREVTKKRVAEFKKKKGRTPNRKEMQDIVSSAWAICRKSLNM